MIILYIVLLNCFCFCAGVELPYTYECELPKPRNWGGRKTVTQVGNPNSIPGRLYGLDEGRTRFCDVQRGTNCPYTIASYYCGKVASENLYTQMKSRLGFEYADLDVPFWLKSLKGKRTLLLGDSVHSHLAYALMCLLRDYTKGRVSPAEVFPEAMNKLAVHRTIQMRLRRMMKTKNLITR